MTADLGGTSRDRGVAAGPPGDGPPGGPRPGDGVRPGNGPGDDGPHVEDMRNRRLVIDLDRCWGCRACEVACKREHGLPPGPSPLRVERVGPRLIGDRLRLAFVPCMCVHCETPGCMKACPSGALERGRFGEVRLVENLCTACGVCAGECPYGAVEIGPPHAAGPIKCDLCGRRLAMGLPPSCLQHCEGRAMALLDDDALQRVLPGRYSWSVGKVVYVSTEWPALGRAL